MATSPAEQESLIRHPRVKAVSAAQARSMRSFSDDEYDDENRALIGNEKQIEFTGLDMEKTIQLLYQAVCALPMSEGNTLGNRRPELTANFETESLNIMAELERQTKIPGDKIVRHMKALLQRYELYNACMSELVHHAHVNEETERVAPVLDSMLKAHRHLFKNGLDFVADYERTTARNKQLEARLLLEQACYDQATDEDRGASRAPSKDLNDYGFEDAKKIFDEFDDEDDDDDDNGDDSKRKSKPMWVTRLQRIVPAAKWMPEYNWKADGLSDLSAGIAVAMMLVTQSMAYAQLANLPAEYGLYATIVPCAMYVMFGTSRHLQVGPVAIVSLMVSDALGECPEDLVADKEGCGEYLAKTAFWTSFLAGLVLVGMGIFRLGFIVNFLSHPVLVGYISAAGIIISLTQVGNLLGYKQERVDSAIENIEVIVDQAGELWDKTTLIWSAICLFAMEVLKYVNGRFKMFKKVQIPSAMLVTVIAILIEWQHHDTIPTPVLKDIPQGAPPVSNPFNPSASIAKASGNAMTIMMIGFCESIAIGKNFATRWGYTLRNNQEMVALGMSNLIGSFFSSYPVAGSFSRSAVMSASGGRTQMANVVVIVVLLIVVGSLTKLFYWLPKCTLASIIVPSAMRLVDYETPVHLWKTNWRDFVACIGAFAATFCLGVEEGIGVSILISLGMIILFNIRPPISVLGRVPGSVIYRDKQWYRGVVDTPGGVIFRMDAALYFLNAAVLESKINKLIKETKKAGKPVRFVVIDCRGMVDVDVTGIEALEKIYEDYKKRNILVVFSTLNEFSRRIFDRSGFGAKLGEDGIFPRTHDAVEFCVSKCNDVEGGESLVWNTTDSHVGQSLYARNAANRGGSNAGIAAASSAAQDTATVTQTSI